jgi:hypothetical protein
LGQWDFAADEPDIVVNFFNADRLAGKDRTEINP